MTDASRSWIFPGLLALAAIAVALLGDGAADILRFERQAILRGEPWRLLTGHLVHLGWAHLLLNLAGLALVWALFGARLAPRVWLSALLLAALGTGIGLLLLRPELLWYVGLSGVLHGLLVLGALAAVWAGEAEGWLLLAGIAAKLLWEQWAGPLPGSESMAGGPVVVDAHLFGALAGGLAGLWLGHRRRR